MLKKLKSFLLGGPPPDLPETVVRQPMERSASSQNVRGSERSEAQSARQSHKMPGEFERVFGRDEVDPTSWIGVDLDGTLSEHSEKIDIHYIGPPVPEMVARVKDWIAHGYTVKILTARASVPEGIKPVEDWLKEHNLPELEVTCEKDFHMIELWDDRGVQVIANTGNPVGPSIFDQAEADEDEPDADPGASKS